LERLAKHFEQRLPAEPISCEAITRNEDGSYSDQVHAMFDTHVEAAKRIPAGLLHRRDRFTWWHARAAGPQSRCAGCLGASVRKGEGPTGVDVGVAGPAGRARP
jgi:hypothetical protein